MFKVGIITASDKGSKGQREDRSGEVISEIVKKKGYTVEKYVVLPDDIESISNEMIHMCDELNIDLVLTTGGTGFAKRDVTPEATLKVIDKLVPGIPEAMRSFSLKFTERAMLSRATSGIRKDKTLIINLPGSPKAVTETLEYIIDSVHHGLEIMTGRDSECAR